MKYILVEIDDNSDYEVNYCDAAGSPAPDAVLEFTNVVKIHRTVDFNPFETIDRLKSNIYSFLRAIGDKSECKDSRCRRTIFWVKNPKSGKRMPVTDECLNHFADCPAANSFRRKTNGN